MKLLKLMATTALVAACIASATPVFAEDSKKPIVIPTHN